MRTAAPPVDRREAEIDRLAVRWAALAPVSGRFSPVLYARLVALLHRIAARCRDEPFWPARARRLGEDLLRSGLCGEPTGPPHFVGTQLGRADKRRSSRGVSRACLIATR